jgi:hypothetical protein
VSKGRLGGVSFPASLIAIAVPVSPLMVKREKTK